MKTLFSAAVILCALSTSATASVGGAALNLSNIMEIVSVLQHDHCHDSYDDSFGSHGLETAATALHLSLIDYAGGVGSEAQIFADYTVLQNAVQNYNVTIAGAGVLNAGDATVDLYHTVINNMFLRLSFNLQDLDPFGS